jgi:hypothetical protein
VYEDLSSFRGDIKNRARAIVESEYGLFIDLSVPHNSDDAIRHTVDRVKFLLDKGTFLRAEELDSAVSASEIPRTFLTHCNARAVQKIYNTKQSEHYARLSITRKKRWRSFSLRSLVVECRILLLDWLAQRYIYFFTYHHCS